MCDGVIGPGDPEYEAHREHCPVCRFPSGFLTADSTAYRPHTFTDDCWCTEFQTLRHCWLDRIGYEPGSSKMGSPA